MFIVDGETRMIVIRSVSVMKLYVSVHHRLVVVVRLVQMLLRHRRRHGEPRRQDQGGDRTQGAGRHALIMGTRHACVNSEACPRVVAEVAGR